MKILESNNYWSSKTTLSFSRLLLLVKNQHCTLLNTAVKLLHNDSGAVVMSTKRKSTILEEVSPKPKRRLSTVAKKRTRDDSDDEKPATVVKTSRKKAVAVEAVEEEPVTAPTPKKRNARVTEVVASPTKTPRKSRNSLSSQFWIESMQLSSPVRKSASPIVKDALESSVKPAIEKIATPSRSFLPAPDVTGSRWSARYEVVMEDEESDGKICFWKHACNALHTAMAVVTPVFLTMIFVSYVVAAILTDHTVAIASMGITFCMVLVLIFSSYLVAVFPSIYVTRLFTALVMTPNDSNATKWPWQWKRNLNFYSTFTALCVLAILSMVIIFSV